MMLLNDLLRGLDIVVLDGNLDRPVAGVTYDVRRVNPGMVYCALPGLNQDGHEHIEQAIERGAIGIVCERNGMIRQRAAKIQVRHSRQTLAQLSARIHQHPQRKLQIIGVTGGKSRASVAFLLKQILEQTGHATGLISSTHCEIGSRLLPGLTPQAESIDYQQLLAYAVRAQMGTCVIEIDPEAIGPNRMGELGFDLMVVTQGYDHTQEVQTNRFVERLARSGRKSVLPVVLGLDDAFGRHLRSGEQVSVQRTYGLSERAQLRAVNLELLRDGTRFAVRTGGEQHPCPTQLVGRQSVQDTLAALAGAEALGLAIGASTRIIGRLNAPGMLQPLRRAAGWSIFVDGAKTPSDLREVLATLRELGPQRLITVLGCADGSSPALCEAMGQAAADGADLSLITSDNPRHQSPHTLAMQVLRGYATRRNDGARLELNREAAILAAVRMAQPSDIILIAGKGHASSQEIAGAIMPFNDLEQARESVHRVKTSSTPPVTLPRFITTPTRSFYPVGQN